eukprot:jgi/Chlat1/6869/Chrsp51S06544
MSAGAAGAARPVLLHSFVLLRRCRVPRGAAGAWRSASWHQWPQGHPLRVQPVAVLATPSAAVHSDSSRQLHSMASQPAHMWPLKVCTKQEMGALDGRAMDEFGISETLLMENAGESVYYLAQRVLSNGVWGKTFCVIAGVGNNGGDALVVARKLHSSGAHVTTFVLADPSRCVCAASARFCSCTGCRYKEGATTHLNILRKSGCPIVVQPATEEIKVAVQNCDAVVDGLLGTGVTRDVEGQFKEVIELVNASNKTVISLDIPSGIDGDDAQPHGAAVRATHTVTFGLPKLGNLLFPGFEHCGRLYVSHISYPPELTLSADIKVEVNDPPLLPPRDTAGHKGTFGDALFIAGSGSYFGAPTFAALSALKSGAGYARLAAPKSVVPYSATLASELVFLPQKENERGSMTQDNMDQLLQMAEKVDFVVMGPGLSLDEETQQLIRDLTERIETPLLLDGDGLTAISKDTAVVKRRKHPTVLTPHLGELARVLGISTKDVKSDLIKYTRQLAADLGAVVVCKGAHTLIGTPDGHIWINMSGNSGMGTAGSGDVLTGCIAAMHGAHLSTVDAARTGVFLHGLAGDLAAQELGQDGMTAKDILEHMPKATKLYRENYDSVMRHHYNLVETL